MSRSVDVGVRLDAPHLEPKHRLNGVVRAYLERRAAPVAPVGPSPWPAAFFGLEKVKLFREASAEQRAQIVKSCAQNLLVEAYAIEKLTHLVGHESAPILFGEVKLDQPGPVQVRAKVAFAKDVALGTAPGVPPLAPSECPIALFVLEMLSCFA